MCGVIPVRDGDQFVLNFDIVVNTVVTGSVMIPITFSIPSGTTTCSAGRAGFLADFSSVGDAGVRVVPILTALEWGKVKQNGVWQTELSGNESNPAIAGFFLCGTLNAGERGAFLQFDTSRGTSVLVDSKFYQGSSTNPTFAFTISR